MRRLTTLLVLSLTAACAAPRNSSTTSVTAWGPETAYEVPLIAGEVLLGHTEGVILCAMASRDKVIWSESIDGSGPVIERWCYYPWDYFVLVKGARFCNGYLRPSGSGVEVRQEFGDGFTFARLEYEVPRDGSMGNLSIAGEEFKLAKGRVFMVDFAGGKSVVSQKVVPINLPGLVNDPNPDASHAIHRIDFIMQVGSFLDRLKKAVPDAAEFARSG